MNKSQENRVTMFNIVRTYMNTNNAKWSANPAIVAIMAVFGPLLIQINAIIAKQTTTSTGATTDKGEAKHTLATRVSEIVGPARGYAESQNDNNLYAQLNYTFSKLFYDTRDEQMEGTITAIIGFLTPLLAIPASGIIAADITEINNLFTAFDTASDIPRIIIVDKSTATDTLEPKIDEASILLEKQLDQQMLRYRTSDSTFYLGYKGSRTIVDN